MKLEQNEKQLLFSQTEIPDIFFAEHLSEIPGDYGQEERLRTQQLQIRNRIWQFVRMECQASEGQDTQDIALSVLRGEDESTQGCGQNQHYMSVLFPEVH